MENDSKPLRIGTCVLCHEEVDLNTHVATCHSNLNGLLTKLAEEYEKADKEFWKEEAEDDESYETGYAQGYRDAVSMVRGLIDAKPSS